MKLQRRKPEEVEVNLTPMIDVVFLLLIFFMVSTTFKKTSDIEVMLPKASDHPIQSHTPPLEVMVDAQGHYYVNHIRVAQSSEGALMAAIRQGASGNPQQPVFLKADAQARHQSVITVMDVLRQLGLTQLSILTE